MAGEAQAKLHILLRELMETFEDKPNEANDMTLMRSLFEKSQYHELIELCEAYGHGKPFIDHDLLAGRLKNSLYALHDCLQVERKNLKKRLNTLLADTKADKEVINKLENLIEEIDDRINRNYSNCIRAKHKETIPIKLFTENEKFAPLNDADYDPMAKAVEQTMHKGYVIVNDKTENKTFYFKPEEYRKYLSFYSDFPISKS